QLIEECFVEVPEEQKQNMEDTMFDLVKICHFKEFLCFHDDIDDLIESAFDSKLLSINSINSQRLDKKEQEAKMLRSSQLNVEIVLKKPEHLLSMGYEHFSITPKTESNEVTESNAENLLPILSKCEVTLEDEIECNMPAKDVCSPVFTTFSNPLFKDNDDVDSSDDESLSDEDVPAEEFKIYSNPLCDEDKINSDKLDPHCFNVEYDFVESLLNRDTFIDFSSKFDFSEELNAEIANIIIESIPLLPIPVQNGNSQREEIDIVTSSDDVLPPNVESFFDLKPDMIAEEISDKLNEDKCFDPGREINVSTKIEDDDYFPFMFVIRFFLPYFIFPEVSPLLLSAESEDTIFDAAATSLAAIQEEAATWLAANDLCMRYCAGGGWTNWKMTRHHGTVAAVRGVSTRSEKSVRGSEKIVQGSEKEHSRS
nr:hypothetical protein [Tanacetum cinerariifolium]